MNFNIGAAGAFASGVSRGQDNYQQQQERGQLMAERKQRMSLAGARLAQTAPATLAFAAPSAALDVIAGPVAGVLRRRAGQKAREGFAREAAKLTDTLRAEVVAAKPELLTLLGAKAGESEPIEDAEAHLADRQARALQRQRERRARRSRIDYYPSADASKVIDSLRHRSVGGDASSIIDRALIEWGASGIPSGPKRPEARRCCDAQEARKHSS